MLLTKEELDKTAVILPEIAERLALMPKRDPEADMVEPTRAALKMMSDAILAQMGPAPDGITEFYHDIAMRDGYMSSIKVQKPLSGTPGALAVFAYGGGFLAGDYNQLANIGRALAVLCDTTVVSVSYRHAPEYKFPMSQYDTWDSMKWIAENATGSLLGADPSKGFIMGGVSAGACLTAVFSRKFQQEKLAHPLTGQWLYAAPTMDEKTCPEEYKSYYIAHEQNANNAAMSKEAFERMVKITEWDMTSDLRNASLAKAPLSGQPKTYFQIEGVDILRDDGLVYDEMLKEAGVSTKVDLYPGCVHGTVFHMMGAELGNRILIDSVVGIAWLLNETVSREDAAAAMNVKAS